MVSSVVNDKLEATFKFTNGIIYLINILNFMSNKTLLNTQ